MQLGYLAAKRKGVMNPISFEVKSTSITALRAKVRRYRNAGMIGGQRTGNGGGPNAKPYHSRVSLASSVTKIIARIDSEPYNFARNGKPRNLLIKKMERGTGIEPVTSSLGSSRSTAELTPLICVRGQSDPSLCSGFRQQSPARLGSLTPANRLKLAFYR
jgi:hypothetical protein